MLCTSEAVVIKSMANLDLNVQFSLEELNMWIRACLYGKSYPTKHTGPFNKGCFYMVNGLFMFGMQIAYED